jgi:hypothetical protein
LAAASASQVRRFQRMRKSQFSVERRGYLRFVIFDLRFT